MKKQLLLLVTMLLAVVMPMKLWAADGNAEPYAVLSNNDTKLTFYYDTEKDARGGMDVGPFYMNNDGFIEGRQWNDAVGGIITVVFDDSFANCTSLTSTAHWFSGCDKLTDVFGIDNLKTDYVTNIGYMFSGCSSLTSLDLSHFNTAKVTDMRNMFSGCSGLTNLDVSNFNTTNVTYMYSVFYGCSGLTSLDVSGFNTANVKNMDDMFFGCSGLTSLDLSSFNTVSVLNMGNMFCGCSGLTSLDLSEFNTDNVTNMGSMFYGCSGLTRLDVSSFNTKKVIDMSGMFGNCSGLKSLEVNNFNTAKVTTMSGMFVGCYSLTSLDLSSFNTANVTGMHFMFERCSSLTRIYVGNRWNTSKIEDGNGMFAGCINLIGGAGTVYDDNHVDYTYAHIDGGENNPGYFSAVVEPYAVLSQENTVLTFFYDDQKEARGGMSVGPFGYYEDVPWYSQRESITSAEFDPSFANCTTLTSTTNWFNGCKNMVSISGIQYLNTDNVTDMSDMFYGCSGLTSLDVSGFNTANVKYMGGIFYGCSSLTSFNVSGFNTANVTDMRGMFSGCSGLTSLDLSGFNTANVTDMRGMFSGCSGLTSLDLSGFNTANVTDMNSMFYGCSGLTSLDVSGFNTDNVTSMNSMFENCSGLNAIDISNFNTANVKYMDGVFRGCSGLTSLDVSRFNTENVTAMRYMFYGCSSLTSLDVTNFKTDHVTSMQWMFRDCSGLTSLDVSHFNTGNVVNMSYMFANCSHITSLDVSNFNTSKVTDMSSMFYGCSGLTSLNVSNFNTSNATTMTYMFGICSHITTLDLSNFNTSKVTDMNFMFKDCSALTTIFVGSEWVTSSPSATVDMFEGCTSLVGGAGTVYDANHIDHTYAHIDGGTSNPGYFTSKDAPEGKTKVESIRFEQDGEYLTMTSPTDGAEIFYSMHYVNYGTTETPSGTRENGYRLWMPYSCTVDAYALKEGYENSDTTRFVYTKPAATYEFDGRVLRVNNGGETGPLWIRMSDIPYRETITAIVWNSEEKLTAYYIQGINNPNLLVYVNDASLAPQGVQNVVINGQAREIVLTDAQDGNNDWYAPQAFVAERISYTRNFGQSTTKGTSRGWESIALPFDVQTIQHESKGVIAPFNNSASNKHFWLRRLTENGLQPVTGIEANIPYIISMPNSEEYTDDYNLNGRVTFSAQNASVPATVTNTLALADSSIVMVPAMQRKERSSAVWALNVGEVRGQYFEGSVFERDYRTVRPFEAYTIHRQENSQPAPRYIPIQEIGGTTGIETIDREPLTLNQWYDMQGRKLQGQPKQKGVYISKGKKVVVK